MIGASEQILLR